MPNSSSLAIPFAGRSTADDVLSSVDLAGKTILISGCNSGIGFETMRALLDRLQAGQGQPASRTCGIARAALDGDRGCFDAGAARDHDLRSAIPCHWSN